MGIAHELITHGWAHGTMQDDEGRVCLSGAAVLALFDGEESSVSDAWDRASEEQRARYTNHYFSVLDQVCRRASGNPVVPFNDAPGRTYDQVLRVAKEADEILGL